ncbi:MAG: L-2-hydroxyglutarate oxidase, partial [Actinomycetota bacterium]|nr:L-2-hydroxyglutarate oxidase [Actinomycetota bacterium]
MDPSGRPPSACDIAVVGGGILGLAVARELLIRHPDLDLCLLEAEDRIGSHQTSHNSGVIHAGVYYEPGSLRARLCVEGAILMESFCIEHGIPWRHAGKLIVATHERELPRLDALESRGRANDVRGLTRVGPDGIAAIEPGARGLAALHSPFTGITDFGQVAEALGAEVETRGGTICTGAAVTGVDSPRKARLHSLPRSPGGGRGMAITTTRGTVGAGKAVFCAGLQADRLARLTGGDPAPRIVPIRGGYLKVRPEREDLVRGNLYPVPDPALPFLGAHLTRTVDGSLLIGPTAMLAGARDA